MASSPDDNYWIDKIDDPFARGLTGTLWDVGKRFVGTSFNYFRDRQQTPNNNQFSLRNERNVAFATSLLKTWFAAFDTIPEAMTLSGEEIEILDKYLYANLLIIQCKEAATRVTDTTWKKIESRMLLPVD